MENKQMVHIVSEVVILVGLTFYFNQQNKKMKGYIEDLAQRVEDHEDLIQKHEQVIRKLVEHINQKQESPPQVTPQLSKRYNRKRPIRGPPSHTKSPLSPVPEPVPIPMRVSFDKNLPKIHQIEEVFSEESETSDLDTEIAEELRELDSDIDNKIPNLKKEE